MNIRTKLFTFLPLFVIVLNCISFSIYHTSTNIQTRYESMMQRILVYKELREQTDQTLRAMGTYIIRHTDKHEKIVLTELEELQQLNKTLRSVQTKELHYLQLKNLQNETQTFIEQSRDLYTFLKNEKSPSIASRYQEIERLASFIQQDGQQLVDEELSFYQSMFQTIEERNDRMEWYGFLLFIVSTLLSILFAIQLSQNITLPVKTLISISNQIGKGNFNITIPEPKTKDELGQLSSSVHTMYTDLKQLIQNNMELLEKDRLVKELKLKALQSQMNPHFLYNTLNTASKLAYIEGAERTSELIVSISDLLRYNLRDLKDTVTIKEEFEHIQSYFAIQQMRFHDRVTYTIHLDEQAAQQQIPCLSLQPLVENAFIHGIEHLEFGGHIHVSAVRKDRYVQICIADNGEGMREDVKEALLLYLSQSIQTIFPTRGHVTGIGTVNVLKRLQLFYGKKMKMTIDNKNGTTILFTVPLKTEETA